MSFCNLDHFRSSNRPTFTNLYLFISFGFSKERARGQVLMDRYLNMAREQGVSKKNHLNRMD